MTTALTPELIATLRSLSADDKQAAIDILLPDDATAALRAELTRRWERYKDGSDPSHAAEDVIAELRAQAERRTA